MLLDSAELSAFACEDMEAISVDMCEGDTSNITLLASMKQLSGLPGVAHEHWWQLHFQGAC